MIRWFLTLPFKLLLAVLRLLSAPKVLRSRSGDEAAVKYAGQVECLHGVRHVPLHTQSYAKALEKAKTELRFLLVILTSEIHDDTPAMLDLLGDDTLRSYIIDNNILVWAGNVAELDAYSVSRKIGANRYPFIGLMVYDAVKDSRMACVATLGGVPTNIDLMSLVQECLDKYGPTLISLKADRREQNFAREIRAEQDSAYEISLRKDKEKTEILKREREEQVRKDNARLQRSKDMATWRRWQSRRLAHEPNGTTNMTRISFRMPDGTRNVRKFPSSSTLEDIFIWVDLKLNTTESPDESCDAKQPVNYKHSFQFTLAVPMPRVILEATSQVVSERKEIFPSGSLIVELLEDPDES